MHWKPARIFRALNAVYECLEKIPYTLITDGMVAHWCRPRLYMLSFLVAIAWLEMVIPRIKSAVLVVRSRKAPWYPCVRRHASFYLWCSLSWWSVHQIEEQALKVRAVQGHEIAQMTSLWNPGFDVTPASLIDAWISEEGVTTSASNLVQWVTGSKEVFCRSVFDV